MNANCTVYFNDEFPSVSAELNGVDNDGYMRIVIDMNMAKKLGLAKQTDNRFYASLWEVSPHLIVVNKGIEEIVYNRGYGEMILRISEYPFRDTAIACFCGSKDYKPFDKSHKTYICNKCERLFPRDKIGINT